MMRIIIVVLSFIIVGLFAVLWKYQRQIKDICRQLHFLMLCVVAAGFVFRISVSEWCICLILFGMILSLELVNTAMEAVVDLVTEERRPLAKLAKDTAAGAVLIAAIMAAGVGLLIFVPKVLELI